MFDFAEITAAIIVLNAKLQDEDDKLAWYAVLLFTGLGILANIAHAGHAYYINKIDHAQAILAVFATALFPLSVALVTHLLKSVITRSIKRSDAVETLNELRNEITQKRNELAQLNEQIAQSILQVNTQKTLYETEIQAKSIQIKELEEQIEELRLSIERLKSEHQNARKGKFPISKNEREAYLLDGMLYAGMTLTVACSALEISPNTARKRLNNLNGARLSK